WDNPSHMRFGFPEDVVPVPPPNLLDEAGRGGALTATYFADREMREPLGPAGRGYPSAASLPADVAAKVRAARWTGALLPEATGEYGLYSHRALNDVRLWLDNSLLINYWSLFVRADEAELLEVVRQFRQRRFPLDVIVQDWRYWRDKQWGSHEFDPERFPDPKGMVDEAHRLDARVAISLWPKFDRGTTNFEQMSKAGLLYPYPLGRRIRDLDG